MSNAHPPRLHHYFPQFHLRYFTREERLWAYDKRNRLSPNPKALTPQVIAAEAHLYTDDDSGFEGVEEWLAEAVDGPGSRAFLKVQHQRDISVAEREDIARYVIARDLRTPIARDFVTAAGQLRVDAEYEVMTRDLTKLREDIRDASGTAYSDERLRELVASFRVEMRKGFWLDFLQHHTVGAVPRLLAKGWTLLHATGGSEFISSDVGILKYRGGWGNPVPTMPGWWNCSDCWVMPISPALALVMAVGLKGPEKLVGKDFIDPFNRNMAQQAGEFVFAQTESTLRHSLNAA